MLQRQLFIFAPFLRRKETFETASGGKTVPHNAAMYAAESAFCASLLLSYANCFYLLLDFI